MLYNEKFAELTRRRAAEHVALIETMLDDQAFLNTLEKVAMETGRVMAAGGKLLLFGNGGSAADAQHIAAELVGRFGRERKGLPAVALTVNTSALTAIANDHGFERVFARQVEALALSGDLAIGISTSGNSRSVLKAVDAAKSAGILTVGLTGRTGGDLRNRVDYCLQVPSESTPRVQEAHIFIGHVLCEWIEESLFEARADESV
ncbi:MAG TPA: D-sedoheptulose 7-phosphate isomerase [Terriglobia bacterium]|nr:D-sedoheptulose 7-phosphate isomerase [Terriglobia bacterium]